MAEGHEFNFEGGGILTKIGAAWFVSYAYYNYIDPYHLNWKNHKFSDLSVQQRKNGYDKSHQYHLFWLQKVLEMQQLDKHKNFCGLHSSQIKMMAAEILIKMLESKLYDQNN